MRALLGRVSLVVGFSLSSLEIYHTTPFWPAEFLLKNQLMTLSEFLCMLFFAFPLLLLIFSVYHFVILITMCLGVILFELILYGTLHFLDLGDGILSLVKEVFSYYVFKYFLRHFLSLFSFWDLYNENVVAFNVVPEVS